MIKMGEQVYAIPLDAVATTTKLESVRLTDVKGRKAVTMRGEVLGIVDLGELLNLLLTRRNCRKCCPWSLFRITSEGWGW